MPSPPATKTLSLQENCFIFGVVVPLVLVVIGLRVMGLLSWWDTIDVPSSLVGLGSDALILSAFALSGLAMLKLSSHAWAQWMGLGVMQALSLGWMILEIIAHNFFGVTGSSLDFKLLSFALTQISDTFELVNQSTPIAIKALLGCGSLLFLAVPWVSMRIFLKRGPMPQKKRGAAHAALLLCLASTLGALSVTVSALATHKMLARNATENVVLTGIESFFEPEVVIPAYAAAPPSTLERKMTDMPQNVVVILLESTRASATSLHPPYLATTPFLKDLATRSIFATHAYTVIPHTSKALVSTLCGSTPNLTVHITEAQPLGLPGKCMAKLYGEQGYDTAFFQPATRHFEDRPVLTKNMGYTDFFAEKDYKEKAGFERANYFGYEDDIMLAPASAWLKERQGNAPFFLTFLTLTPHHQYLPVRRYGRRRYLKEMPTKDQEEFNDYLNSVHYVDNFVRNVFDLMKAQGVYENTVFVIVGDHGEGFAEHGRRQHDNTIYQEGLHIPLLIHRPGLTPEGKKVTTVVNQLDILPTVVRLSGHNLINPTNYDGRDILSLDPEKDADRTVMAHCWYDKRCMALIGPHHKVIHHFDTQPDEVFDLRKDPLEKENLAKGQATLMTQSKEALKAWRQKIVSKYKSYYAAQIKNLISANPYNPEFPLHPPLIFQDAIKLVGWDLGSGEVKPEGRVDLNLYYEVLAPWPKDWDIVITGKASYSTYKAIYTHVPLYGHLPYHEWTPGSFVKDTFTLTLPPGMIPGETYAMTIEALKEGKEEKKEEEGETATNVGEKPVPKAPETPAAFHIPVRPLHEEPGTKNP